MSSAVVAIIGLIWLVLGYRFYGNLIVKKLGKPDGDRKTPAHTQSDGMDYQPTRPVILFGHHFSSIAGAGPIVGPVAAALAFGWVAGAVWILLGVVFIGAVHDYMALMISIRHGGHSLSDTTRALVGKRSWVLFQIFVWFTLVLVIAVFINVAAKSFMANPNIVIPAFALIPIAFLFGLAVYRFKMPVVAGTLMGLGLLALSIWAGMRYPIVLPGDPDTAYNLWFGILALYSWAASVMPVWLLLQPRDYIANWVLILGMAMGFVGLLYTNYPITAPAVTGFLSPDHAPMYPMLFILIACGAVSGFHSLVASGTTSKQLNTERDAKLIGFGSMIAEGGVALVALLAVCAGLYWQGTAPAGQEHLVLQTIKGGPIAAFGTGYGRFLEPLFGLALGTMIGITMLNTFVMTTLDTAARLTRFVTTELVGERMPLFRNRYVASAAAVVPAYLLGVSGGWQALWPMFATSNQMIAALALFVASVYLIGVRRPAHFTLLPGIFMLATTISALVWQGYQHLFVKTNWLLGSLCVVLLILAVLVVFDAYEAIGSLRRRKLEAEAGASRAG